MITLNLTPLEGASTYFDLDLYAMANPDATVYTDAISFTAPEPAGLAAIAAILAIVPLRRRYFYRQGNG